MGLLASSMFPVANQAQNINYAYDSAGNRKERTITLSSPARSSSNAEEEKTEDTVFDVIAKQEVKIYSNPTKGLIKVELINFDNALKGEIAIIDPAGKTVAQTTSLSAENSFDLTGKAEGIYVMKIKVGTEVSTWKIIKK